MDHGFAKTFDLGFEVGRGGLNWLVVEK